MFITEHVIRAYFTFLSITCTGKIDIPLLLFQLRKKQVDPAVSADMYSECDMLVLIESCVASVLNMGMLSNEKSTLQLGATSFDVVKILNLLEEKLQISFETGIANLLFECLLTAPVKEVAQRLFQIVQHGLQRSDDRTNMSAEEVLLVSRPTAASDSKQDLTTSTQRSSLATSDSSDPSLLLSSVAKRPLSGLHGSDEGLINSSKRAHCEESVVGLLSWRRGQLFRDGR